MAGNRIWHFMLHDSNDFDNNLDCPSATFSSPVGAISFSPPSLMIKCGLKKFTLFHCNLRRYIEITWKI